MCWFSIVYCTSDISLKKKKLERVCGWRKLSFLWAKHPLHIFEVTISLGIRKRIFSTTETHINESSKTVCLGLWDLIGTSLSKEQFLINFSCLFCNWWVKNILFSLGQSTHRKKKVYSYLNTGHVFFEKYSNKISYF